MAKDKDEPEVRELLHQLRMSAIEGYREEHPMLGEFSAEQYVDRGQGMGAVYIPDWGKKGLPFTKLKPAHVKKFFKAYVYAETTNAAREGRVLDMTRIIAYAEWLLAQIDGWASNEYLQTGLAALGEKPKQKPGVLDRLKIRLRR